MIRRILVPTDHSPSANQALVLAADLAWTYQAELVVLHVGLRGADIPEVLAERAREAFERAEAAGEAQSAHPDWSPRQQQLEFAGRMVLEEAREIAARQGVAEPVTVLEFGDCAERILHHAAHRAVDMIVMGSHGHGTLKEILIGSVSNKVQHLAPCATVTVRQPGERAEEGFRTILVATDGSANASRAIELASDIAAKVGARLVVLHILLRDMLPERIREMVEPGTLSDEARAEIESEATDALRYAALPVPLISPETLAEVGRLVLERAHALAATAGITDIETVMIEGDPARTLVEQAEARNADLVVLGSRGLGPLEGLLLGSVSSKVSHLLNRPCVVVR